MSTLTSKIKLTKPLTSENYDVAVVNTNADLIDTNIGTQIVTSSTRPSGGALFTGLNICETDTKLFLVYDGSSWVDLGNADDTFKVKTAATSVTSSTAFIDDGHLVNFPVAANATYFIHGGLLHGGVAGGDIKVQFVYPAGALLSIIGYSAELSTASNNSTLMNVGGISVAASPAFMNSAIGTAGGVSSTLISAVLTSAGTAGTWKIQLTQFTSNASASSLFQGSHFRSLRVS